MSDNTLNQTQHHLPPDSTAFLAASPPPPDGAEAELWGRYRVHGEIARGGMGAVFRGRDPELERDLGLALTAVSVPAAASAA